MEFEVTTSVFIDIDYIIEFYKLDSSSSKAGIKLAIDDYVDGMDDCDYCLVNSDIKQRVLDEIFSRINGQMSLFDD